MPSTKMMMMMTNASAEKSTEDTHLTDSSDQSAHSSRPSTACSSSDLCTPMPHTMSHTIDPKRLSVLSDSSLQSAGTDGYSTGAPSDANSNDSPAPQSALPSTPPSFTAPLPTQQPGPMARAFMRAHGHDIPNLHPAMKPWSAGDVPDQILPAKPSDVDGLYPSSADNVAAYDAFTSWRSQPVGQQPILDYHRGVAAHMGGASGHSRTASYQSTLSSSSVDSSWSGSRHSGGNPMLDPYAAGLTTPLTQMSLSPIMPSMNAYPPGLPGRFRQARLLGLQGQMPVPDPASRSDDSRTLADSLANLSAAYGSPQMGYATYPRQYLDPAMMAYSGALAAAPLLELYGITPEMLSARSGALSRLATGAAPGGGPISAATGASDEGPSPANKKTNLYKTELCRSWEEKGSCRYGSKCQFAHGQDELRSVNRHPKFKTEICRTFWLHGSCPYGKRCCFLHTTATDAGTPPASGANAEAASGARNAHDPPTSRLQQRTSSGPGPVSEKALGLSLSPYVSNSPRLQSAPPVRSQSELGHSRSSSTSRSSQTSSIDGLRIQIGPRFGPREQVPAQDAPGPRSRLERLRPTSDYADSTSSMPTTSTASTTRYSPFLDRHQPPHSAFSDISSVLSRSPSRHISKAHSANGDEEVKWPSSRLSGSSITMA